MAGVGGYDNEFVTTPPDRLICKICHNPCRDAHLTSCCGAHFCRSCLQQVRRGRSVSRACPMCRAEKFESFQNKEANREIKALKVYCQNNSNGCTWSGEVNDVKSHVDIDCQFVDMPCPSNCGMILKRQCIQSHLAKDCPCHCQYCGYTGHKMEIAIRHKKHCSQYPMPCPNDCEVGVVPSVGMAAHRKVCPLEIITCEYLEIGCNVRLPRRDIENHNNTEMAYHLKLMNKALVTATQKLSLKAQSMQKTQYDKLINMLTNSDGKSDDKFHAVFAEMDIAKNDRLKQEENLEQLEQQINRSVELIAIKLFTLIWILIVFIAILLVYALYTNVLLQESDKILWRVSLQQEDMFTDGIAPVIVKMSNFTKKKNNKVYWYSSPFLTFDGGHLMHLKVNAFGDGYHVKVALQLLKGPNDDKLERSGHFPLKLLGTVELLNQSRNHNHNLVPIMLDSISCSDCAQRVEKDPYPRGFSSHLISHSAIIKKGAYYLHKDQLVFRVSIMERNVMLYYYYYFMGYIKWESLLGPLAVMLLFGIPFFIAWHVQDDKEWLHRLQYGHMFGIYGRSVPESFHRFDLYFSSLISFLVVIFFIIVFSVIIFTN